MYIVLAFVCGILVILSMIINSHLGKRIGVFQGTFFNYIIGLIFTIIVLTIRNNGFDVSKDVFLKIPIWAYFGGMLGVMVVALSNTVIPKIPTIYATLLIFIGQLFTGIIIDYFNIGLISKGKIIGGFIILAGLTYNQMIDKEELIKE